MLNINRGIHLQVNLNNPSIPYKPGDTIDGVVLMQVEKDVKCKQVVVKNGYKLHGKGNTEYQDLSSLVMHEGALQAGRYQYPFSFTLPSQIETNLPATFHGHYIDLTWQVTAQALLTAIFGPKAHGEYEFQNSPTRILAVDEDINDSPLEFRAIIISLVFLMSFIAINLYLFNQGKLFEDKFLLFFLIIFIFVIPSIVLFWNVMQLIPKLVLKKFGDMNLIVPETAIRNKLEAQLSITAKRNIEVDKLTAYLILEESATSGSGTDATTYTDEKVLSTKSITQSSTAVLPKGQTKTFDIVLDLPETLTATVSMKSNQIIYKIRIVAEVANKERQWEQNLNIIELTHYPSNK